MENKNIIIYGFVILGSILLFSYIFVLWQNSNNGNQDDINLDEVEENKLYELSEVYKIGDINLCNRLVDMSRAVECKINLGGCDPAILSNSDLDRCYFDKSLNDKNDLKCGNIVDESLKEMCFRTVKVNNVYERSILEDDVLVCNEFSDMESLNSCKDNFYFIKRLDENDKVYCERLVSESLKAECYN